MNILFLENKLRIDKLGIMYLSASLKKNGHCVDLIQDKVDNTEEYLSKNKIDYLMCSVMSGEHLWYIQRIKELKQKFNFKVVVGGPHFTFFPEQGEKEDIIDHIVIGPGEQVVLDIVEGRETNRIIKGQLPDMNTLPEPDRSILYKYDEFGKAGMKRFIASRDCPNACTYCFNHMYHKIFADQKKKFFQRRDPMKMIDEIIKVKEIYGLTMVYFNDDDLAFDKEWLKEFLYLYKIKVDLPFCGSVRANNITEDIVKELKDSRCWFLNIALESANPTTQKMLRRGNIKNEQVENAVKWLESADIKVRLQNIIGLPVDDPLADALETFEFNKKINPTDSWVAILQPFYGTDIWKECIDKKLITEDVDCMNFYEGTQLDIGCKKQIDNLHKWWYFAVKYKFPTEFLKILLEQNLDTDIKKKIQDYRWDITAKEIYKL
jgi:anaerobic magnesium-protoporphyrin IX monomethyl ester cyclase